jgi:hypothetical protein
MNCEEFQTVVSDLAREQIMEVRARTHALVHSAGCDDCARSLADERSLSVGLRSLAERMKSLEAGPRVEAQLLASFRDRNAFKSALVRSHRWLYWVGAAAAVVLVVFGVVAMRGRVAPAAQPSDENAKAGVTKPRATTGPSPSILATTSAPGESLPNRPPSRTTGSGANRRHSPSVRSTFTATGADSEIATDFFPVGDGNTLNLEDGGQLVRVELPRSALVRFGLPVNIERGNERVKADVLFGADGLARAIRFVQ